MKNVLAFGDSLTWGANAATGGRHSFEDRWPNVLAEQLKGQVRVFAEGLNGRTTVFDDYAIATERNGAKALPSLLGTHEPLDLVIIMLGTNDMRSHICGNAAGSAMGINRLINIVKTFSYKPDHQVPEILVVSPPLVEKGQDHLFNDVMAGAIELSAEYAMQYERVCIKEEVSFFNAAPVTRLDPVDGVHLDAKNTRALGKALAPSVKKILSL
ncbi:SGNH/GDSL hydrolase family protein [Maritalea sp.]|uniref:SGNH/GDSL hydrolase family protein n=1 Tax=Maritalea sp. TaxID=2003361 RepID=UPI003EF7059D